MNADDYARFLAIARRRSRRADEAEDLLHEALLAAARAGRTDLADPANARWLAGVLRNLSALSARRAIRRRPSERASREAPDSNPGSDDVLTAMAGSSRIVATLILHGLNRDEIAQALDLTPTAFRQRLTDVRRSLAAASPEHRREALALAYRRRGALQELELGLIRRSLLTCLRARGGVGTHDPDGHLLVFSANKLTKAPPRAT